MAQRVSSSKGTEWRKRLRRYGQSGLAVAEFCQREGVSTASFYVWRKRLRNAKHAGKKAGKHGRALFEPVRLTATGVPMAICLPGGVRLEVPLENLDAVRAVVGEVLATAGGGDRPC